MQNRKGESPMENTNVLFDRKRLVRLIVPLIVEQVLAVTVGMADMVMVSGAGETAVSGISLVNTICVLLIVIFTSMASGGSVVGAQFLGSGDKKTACHAAEQLVMICGLIALVICGISFFGNRWILRVVYGSVEEQVMAYAVEYFFITSLSFPFLGIYNAGAALFRVMGNSNISMVTSIGVPQALENSMFQIGKLLTQSMIAGFGTASIAANACAMTVEQLAFMPGSAMGLAMTTVVGQCVGAGDYKQARSYTKKLITGAYAFLWILNILLLAAAPLFAGAYNLSDGAYRMAVIVIRYHSICCMMIWPLAFTLPNTMRSAGDAKFTMTVSILSMWFVRIALAYLIGVSLHVGLLGVWIAQTLDWVVRAGFYIVRYLGHKWENKSVVRQQEKEILAE